LVIHFPGFPGFPGHVRPDKVWNLAQFVHTFLLILKRQK